MNPVLYGMCAQQNVNGRFPRSESNQIEDNIVRSTHYIQYLAASLNGGVAVPVKINPRLQYGDGTCNALTGALALHPVYLDEEQASDMHLQAVLLHELGHAHDWLSVVTVKILLVCVAFWAAMVSMSIAMHSAAPVLLGLIPVMGACGLALLVTPGRENRADAWARARMADFDIYKHLPGEA